MTIAVTPISLKTSANTTKADQTDYQKTEKLRLIISGGGPVGLAFALTVKHLMGDRVDTIDIYDGRWVQIDHRTIWRGPNEGNSRREQVVTIQSRQYSKLPPFVQNALFDSGHYSEMWPETADSPRTLGRPRNMRIAHIEDILLSLADRDDDIHLHPENFEIEKASRDRHLFVIAEGSQSASREYFLNKFGSPDSSIYSLNGNHLEDTVLALRVRSTLPEGAIVLFTISQNRYLLNSFRGDGFLNIRLEPDEIREVIGYNPEFGRYLNCIQSSPCMMMRDEHKHHEFFCPTHGTFFKPAIDFAKGSFSLLWPRIQEGLRLFSIAEEDLLGITAFRLSMVHRPRFTTELLPRTRSTPATFGCLIGDAANAIHFWPGRGLNSGWASAVSLARCLSQNWNGRGLRDADFTRHEAVMAMLQYRHKSRAWRAMVSTNENGEQRAIQDLIQRAYVVDRSTNDSTDYKRLLLGRFRTAKELLGDRVGPLPSDNDLEKVLDGLDPFTIKAMVASGAWDTTRMGGEEVELEFLFPVKAGQEPEQAEITVPGADGPIKSDAYRRSLEGAGPMVKSGPLDGQISMGDEEREKGSAPLDSSPRKSWGWRLGIAFLAAGTLLLSIRFGTDQMNGFVRQLAQLLP
jgi:2-polyprenyl-6-methoxyphenol hydroxylase-like FAD-dependent oxidoreductase